MIGHLISNIRSGNWEGVQVMRSPTPSSIECNYAMIAKHLESCPDTVDMPKEKFIELLGFCLKTRFNFDGTTNEQVKGTPM